MIPEIQLSNKQHAETSQDGSNNTPFKQNDRQNADHINTLMAILHRALITDSQKILLLCIIDYMREFDNNTLLQPIVQSILKEAQYDQTAVNELRKQVLVTLNSFHTELKSYYSSNNITHESPDLFDAYDNPDPQKRIHTTRDVITEKYEALEAQLYSLAQASPNHCKFISRFADVTLIPLPLSARYHRVFSISLKIPCYTEYLNAQEALKNKRPTLIWHHWDCLAWIYQSIKDENVSETLKQDDIFLHWQVNKLRERAFNIINNRRIPATPFDIESLKYSMQVLFDYTHKKTVSINSQHNTSTNAKLFWDKPAGCLYYDNVIIMEVDCKNYEGLGCCIFFRHGKPIKKELHWEVIFEKISSPQDKEALSPKQKKDRVQKMIKRLNLKAEEKGICLFLCRNGYYSINPNPKRFPSK